MTSVMGRVLLTWLVRYYATMCIIIHFFLPGLGVGGLWGLREGAARPLAVSNARLRLNSVLNGVTRRGTFLGNSAGVLGT